MFGLMLPPCSQVVTQPELPQDRHCSALQTSADPGVSRVDLLPSAALHFSRTHAVRKRMMTSDHSEIAVSYVACRKCNQRYYIIIHHASLCCAWFDSVTLC